jgi:hypothetical protein
MTKNGQIGAMLIVVSPTGEVADNFIIAVRKLSVNFSQCVSLKVKLTSRIRRLRFRLFVLPQCAKRPLLWNLMVNCSLGLETMPGGTFGALPMMFSMRHVFCSSCYAQFDCYKKLAFLLSTKISPQMTKIEISCPGRSLFPATRRNLSMLVRGQD